MKAATHDDLKDAGESPGKSFLFFLRSCISLELDHPGIRYTLQKAPYFFAVSCELSTALENLGTRIVIMGL